MDCADLVHLDYPGCPTQEAHVITAHACRRSSGRVGRCAAAKEFDPKAIKLAVAAHIRHTHTNYDEILMETDDRFMARAQIQDKVSVILDQWQKADNAKEP